jgi:hypothetical protein
MSRRSEEYANIEEELVELLDRLLAELPPNVASTEVKRRGPNGEGVVVVLKPQNPASAAVVLHAESGLAVVDFSFGEYGPTWELPMEGDNPEADKKEVLQEINEMCRAVVAGNCKHSRGFLSISGTIHVGERPYKTTDLLVLRAMPPLRGTRDYQPYFSGN